MEQLVQRILEKLQNGGIIYLKEEVGPSQGFTAEEWEFIPAQLEKLRKAGLIEWANKRRDQYRLATTRK